MAETRDSCRCDVSHRPALICRGTWSLVRLGKSPRHEVPRFIRSRAAPANVAAPVGPGLSDDLDRSTTRLALDRAGRGDALPWASVVVQSDHCAWRLRPSLLACAANGFIQTERIDFVTFALTGSSTLPRHGTDCGCNQSPVLSSPKVTAPTLDAEPACPGPADTPTTEPTSARALRAEHRPFDTHPRSHLGRPRRTEPVGDALLAVGLPPGVVGCIRRERPRADAGRRRCQ